jgi:MFS family permease
MRAFRLPFFYGWMIVATAFVTMGLGVNARTAFSLFLPPILDEFDRPRSLTAGAFSFGFLVSAAMSPFLGRLVDHYGPRLVIEMGVGLLAAGLMLAPLVRDPWHLYATLGASSGPEATVSAIPVMPSSCPTGSCAGGVLR